jgi:pyridinium-3,5-biscarboxylic acid mononucleotide synthase
MRKMDKKSIKKILKNLESGKIDSKKALEKLKHFPYEDLGFAKVDSHRDLRKGFPEVVFCANKKISYIEGIFKRQKTGTLMGTRASEEAFCAVKKVKKNAVYFEEARIILSGKMRRTRGANVLVVSAGTSDIPVAEEAAVTAAILGNKVEKIFDIGVAGVHRLFANHKKIMEANVLVVVAGMEGALASIVGGMVSRPVIAVPTSIGYGASFSGIAPLLTMLNSCAPGISVVNIDNGFGAGYIASMINRGR